MNEKSVEMEDKIYSSNIVRSTRKRENRKLKKRYMNILAENFPNTEKY